MPIIDNHSILNANTESIRGGGGSGLPSNLSNQIHQTNTGTAKRTLNDIYENGNPSGFM